MVYALGHPPPWPVASRKMVAQVNRDKKVIVPLRPQELPILQREARLEVDGGDLPRLQPRQGPPWMTLIMTVLRPRRVKSREGAESCGDSAGLSSPDSG